MNVIYCLLLVAFCFIGVFSSHAADDALFYRIVSTQQTRITSLSSNGALSFINAKNNAKCKIECGRSPTSGSWNVNATSIWVQVTNRQYTIQMPQCPLPPYTFYLQGTVVYLDFEMGFYGIRSSTGENYDPINSGMIPHVVGAKVESWARFRPDMVSFHMWGKLVELTWDPCLFWDDPIGVFK